MGGARVIEYLSKRDILAINRRMIETVGVNFLPPNNLLKPNALDYLVEAVAAEMFGNPLYPNIWDKAGVYCFNIIANHIFTNSPNARPQTKFVRAKMACRSGRFD